MKQNTLLPLALVALLAISCDKVDDPYQLRGGQSGSTEGTPRKVLLEDFTGHKCPTCPPAADQIVALHSIYGDKMVVVGIHTMDAFAAPSAPPFETDYRTPAGNVLRSQYGLMYLPVGLVNRKPYNSYQLLDWGVWGEAIETFMGQEAECEILIGPVALDLTNRNLSAQIKVIPTKVINGARLLTLYLTEDHLVSAQLDPRVQPSTVLDYQHRHVLRDTPLGTWGVELIGVSQAPTKGDTLIYDLNYTLPPSVQVLEPTNCALVAYTYESTTREVMQVEERKVGQ